MIADKPITRVLDERARLLARELRSLLEEATLRMNELKSLNCTTEFKIEPDKEGKYRLGSVIVKRVTTEEF